MRAPQTTVHSPSPCMESQQAQRSVLRWLRRAHYTRVRWCFSVEGIGGMAVPIGTAVHERVMPPVREPQFPRMVGLLRRQRLRNAPRARIQRHPQCRRNDRRIATIQIPRSAAVTRTKFINRVITRDINRVAVGQVIYCCWCDEQGKVIDDGTISRLAENHYRWTAADPSLRWFHQNRSVSTSRSKTFPADVAALAIQGPTSWRLLQPFRRRHRRSEIFPPHAWKNCRRGSGNFAHRLHRRPRLRNLDAME